MAISDSHAMHRMPPSAAPSNGGKTQQQHTKTVQHSWKTTSTNNSTNTTKPSPSLATTCSSGGSTLSRSMRYADPWLLHTAAGGKYGTVRCPGGGGGGGPCAAAEALPRRAGTLRVGNGATRASVLPSADPYDLVRRSRLGRSVSPTGRGNGNVNTNSIAKRYTSAYATFGRRSILECDVNPYDLMIGEDNSGTTSHDASITRVGGQRIRVRPSLVIGGGGAVANTNNNNNNNNRADEYEEVIIRQSPAVAKRCNTGAVIGSTNTGTAVGRHVRVKSILKKNADQVADRNGIGSTVSNNRRKGSHFYIPLPIATKSSSPTLNGGGSYPRKKVQFLMSPEKGAVVDPDPDLDFDSNNPVLEEVAAHKEGTLHSMTTASVRLQRSISERLNQELLTASKVVFHDSMALRNRRLLPKPDARNLFSTSDLERLDGLVRTKALKPTNGRRPATPPPAPPTISQPNPIKTTTVYHLKTKESTECADIGTLDTCLKTEEEILTDNKHQQDVKEMMSDEDVKRDAELVNSIVAMLATHSVEMRSKNEFTTRTPTNNSPSAPPRKRSNSNKPAINSNNIEEQIVKISHRIQIRNEFPIPQVDNANNVNTISVNGIGRDAAVNTLTTSILIGSDDYCYSTVMNVINPDADVEIPHYRSSVVVLGTTATNESRRNTKVYISANDAGRYEDILPPNNNNNTYEHNKNNNTPKYEDIDDCNTAVSARLSAELLQSLLSDPVEAVRMNLVPHVCGRADGAVSRGRPRERGARTPSSDNVVSPEKQGEPNDALGDGELTVQESLKQAKISEPRETSQTVCATNTTVMNPDLTTENDATSEACTIGELTAVLPSSEAVEEADENHSLFMYEPLDGSSDGCYTDHSNRSSVTEEELLARNKFYELLADAALAEVSSDLDGDDHHYESIRCGGSGGAGLHHLTDQSPHDPIYEDIDEMTSTAPSMQQVPPPLPALPPPPHLLDDLHLAAEYTTRSIFEGASKYDILSYLVDAKERGVVQEAEEEEEEEEVVEMQEQEEVYQQYKAPVDDAPPPLTPSTPPPPTHIERNDSGVGSETSKCSLSKYRTGSKGALHSCEDCDDADDTDVLEPDLLLCRRCAKRRVERREIIMEIVETEEKYTRDLHIILEEFYHPMLVAGLLTPDQLAAIFLNVEELMENAQALAERLRDAVEMAVEQGDEDVQTVDLGRLFVDAVQHAGGMLHAFETYCVRQGGAALLLASLEKEKELLRIFLRVSQMENAVLRRMNLNSFLMVPVQRVTKYPLLLARLHKVTPTHQAEPRSRLLEAQHTIELHLSHINAETRDVPSKLWRRISSSSNGRSRDNSSSLFPTPLCNTPELDLVNIKLRKIAVDVLEWNHDEAGFALEGRLLVTQPGGADAMGYHWNRRGRTIKLSPVCALLVTCGGGGAGSRSSNNNNNHQPAASDRLVFPRQQGMQRRVREAALLLLRDKGGRHSLLREPLYLDRCVVAADPAWQSYFEVQEVHSPSATYIFRADTDEKTRLWYGQLQYYAQGMGAWRRRRNALPNIMINK